MSGIANSSLSSMPVSDTANRSYAFNSCRSQFFTKEQEHLINFIELYGSLTSLQFTHKTYAYTAPLSQFHLSEAVQFPFCTNIFSYIHKSITKFHPLRV